MFFRRKRRILPPSPPWFKWGLLLFIALIFAGQNMRKSPQAPGMPPVVDTAALPSYSALWPGNTPSPKAEDIETGTGSLPLCGQALSLSLRFSSLQGEAAEQPLTFRWGASDAPPIIQRGITGMRVGGARRLRFDPPLPAGALPGQTPPAFAVSILEITLAEAKPDVSALMQPEEKTLSLQLFDRKTGTGAPARCGDKTSVQLTLWGPEGAALYQDTLEIGLGDSLLPAGLEQAVIGMREGGVRSVILPPAWQSLLNPEQNSLEQSNSPLHSLALPRAEWLLAEIALIRVQPIGATDNPNP